MLAKVQTSERDRKAMAGVTKAARERAKKVNLHIQMDQRIERLFGHVFLEQVGKSVA